MRRVKERARTGWCPRRSCASRSPCSVSPVWRELACTPYPAGRRGSAYRNVGAVRVVLAKLLAHDIELPAEAARTVVSSADLDRVHVGDTAAFAGPRLALAVLDVAAADADARPSPWLNSPSRQER